MFRFLWLLLALSLSVGAAPLPQSEQAPQRTEEELATVAQDVNRPVAERAAALAELRRYPGPNALIAIARGSRSEESALRLGAVRGAEGLSPKLLLEVALPLASDPEPEVRTEAGRVLLPLWPRLPADVQAQIKPAVDDYLSNLQQQPASAANQANLADAYRHLGEEQLALELYQQSIAADETYMPAYINLADLHRQQQRDELAIATLQQALTVNPESADAHFSLGLAHYRQQQPELAAEQLRLAYDNGGNPRHLYTLCVLLVEQPNKSVARQCLDELTPLVPDQVVAPLREQLKAE